MMQVEQLQMRVAGMNEANGVELSRTVAERLADLLPANSADRYIPEIRIQLKGSLPAGNSLAADRIAEQIIREINLLTI